MRDMNETTAWADRAPTITSLAIAAVAAVVALMIPSVAPAYVLLAWFAGYGGGKIVGRKESAS
jgi:hypothetical protein